MGSDEDEQSIPPMRDKARGVAETAGGKVKELTGKVTSTPVGERATEVATRVVKSPGVAISEMSLDSTLTVLEEALEQLVAIVVAQEAELATQRRRIEALEHRGGR